MVVVASTNGECNNVIIYNKKAERPPRVDDLNGLYFVLGFFPIN